MAEINNQLETVSVFGRPNWGAIWAGVFTFIAIWAVFGALGFSIFGPNAAASASGATVGMDIWGIILTIIAMFVAGRTTGGLAGIDNSRDGVSLGMVMFGLAVTAVAIVVAIGGGAFGVVAAGGTHSVFALGAFLYGWPMFLALFLGWLAALGGASTAHKKFPVATTTTVHQHQVGHA